MKAKILLLEDDISLGETLQTLLQKEGYFVTWAETIAEACKFLETQFDIAILDVGLPDGSGFDFSEKIQNTPFIFLTALNSAEDRLEGYEKGAQEYIPKPFHLKELLIRIQKVLSISATNLSAEIYNFDNYRIEKETMSVFESNELVSKLKLRDFQVLIYLIEASPRIISREELLNEFWGEGNYPSTRTVDNTIVRLRNIFSSDTSDWIKSIRGVGYQWDK